MLAAALGTLALLTVTAPLSASAPRALVVVHFAQGPQLSTSDLIGTLDEVLADRTDYAAVPLERAGIDQAALDSCGATRLDCVISEALRAKVSDLLIVGSRPAPNARVSLTLLLLQQSDLEKLARHEIARDDALSELIDQGVGTVAESQPFELKHRAALLEMLEHIFDHDLRALLEASGRWRRWSSFEVDPHGMRTTIEVDGTVVGTSTTVVQVARVKAGVHTISLRASNGRVVHEEIDLVAGQRARIDVPRVDDEEPARWSSGLFWGGASSLAAGGATLILAGVAGGSTQRECSGSNCPVDDRSWARGCDVFDSPRCNGLPQVRLVPLSAALVVAGSLLLGLPHFTEDTFADAPWWTIATSVASGALTYFVLTTVD